MLGFFFVFLTLQRSWLEELKLSKKKKEQKSIWIWAFVPAKDVETEAGASLKPTHFESSLAGRLPVEQEGKKNS